MPLTMPTPAHNASASRRFVRGSSSHAHSARRKFNTPAATHSANCFSKPTLVGSFTPFAKTTPIRSPQDEIEAGLEEHDSSSPGLPTRLRFSSSLSWRRDAIDDASDDEEAEPTSKPDNPAHDGDDDDLLDLLYLEKSRGFTALESSEHEHGENPFEPMPRKRRRVSDTGTVPDNFITISSSPYLEARSLGHVVEDEDYHVQVGPSGRLEATEAPAAHAAAAAAADDDDDDFTFSPTGPASALASSKFRKPAPTVFPTPTTSTRPSFKSPQLQSAAAAVDQSVLSSLPHAFSPSRGRGKRDYIPGGAADTVRRWILALAVDEAKTGQTYVEQIEVVETAGGCGERRCELVKDEKGRRWVLVNEGAKMGGAGSNSTSRKVTVGSWVGIKAPSSALHLQLDQRKPGDLPSQDKTGLRGEEWLVGIMWDVID